MERVTRLVSLAFRAGDAASGPMTWGQVNIWRPLTQMSGISSDFNLRWAMTVPGSALSGVLDALRLLVERHHVLRTHFVAGPEGPLQRVLGWGNYPVELVDADPAEAVAEAEAATARLADTAFDLEQELPARFALVCSRDLVYAVAIAASHVAVDGWSLDLLATELRDRLAGRSPPAAVAWQPLEQSAYEASAAGRRRGHSSLAHWRRQLRLAPERMFPHPTLPAGNLPIKRWRLDSTAVAVAARDLAAQTRTSTSTVLLAAAVLVLRALTGHEVVVIQLISANRQLPRQRCLVAANAQDGLLAVRPTGDVHELIRRTHRDATMAYHYAAYPPDEREALIDEVTSQRGRPVDISAYFNDGRTGQGWTVPSPPNLTREAFGRLRLDSELTSLPSLPFHDMSFYLAVSPVARTCRLSLLMDIRKVPERRCRQVLPGIEVLLGEARFRSVPVDETATVSGLASSGVSALPWK